MDRKFFVLVVVALLLAALAGCAGTPAAPTSVPAPTDTFIAETVSTATTVPAEGKDVLTVNGVGFSMAELEALGPVDVEVEGTSYTGVRILDLLAKAGASDASSITLVAGDGYSAEVPVADLDEECILAFGKDGTLDAVIPTRDKGAWGRDTIEITCTFAQAGDTVLTVAGKPFSMADLKALEQVEVEVEGTTYTGVRVLDLLKAAGISGPGTLRLVASDGYEGQVAIDALTDESILAYNDEGGVNTVLPGMDRGAWVKYVVQIELTAEETSGEPVPTLKPVAEGEGKIVVDSLGREVLIPAQVTRVASMRAGITEIICALGQKEKIVAVDEMVKAGNAYGAFIASVYPDLMDLAAPFAGQDINVEEMLRLKPDLVLHGGYGRIKQAEALMKQVPELPVVIAHFETIEQYANDVRIVAQCVDAEERAETLIAYLTGTLDFVQSRVKDIPENERVRVFYGGHDIYHAYTPETFEHAQITLAGGVNVADEMSGWLPEVSPEQLLVWDPEVIVVLNGVDVDAILKDQRVAGVSAIKNKRVYALPEAGWDFSSPRALFCIEWLATKLYPDRFADVDIEAEADAFYLGVFGVEYSGPALADASQAPTSATHVVTDMLGRRVEIPREPKRVVSVFPYVTYTALALGRQDVLVGVDSTSASNANLAKAFPAIQGIPDVGMFFNVNKESVLAANPELVLTVVWDKDPDKTQATLGVPVVCADMNYYKEGIEFIARVLGGEAQKEAARLISYYQEKMAYIKGRLAGLKPDQRTKVYIAAGDGILSAYGSESTWHYEVKDAGGIHVSEDLIGGGAQQVSAEQLIMWNPDVIVLDKSCPDTVAQVLSDARWKSINAVKTKRVYRAPDGFLDTWGRPHMESVLCRMWLAGLLYPDKVDFDIVKEAQDFYAQFYGVSLSAAEVEKLLNPE